MNISKKEGQEDPPVRIDGKVLSRCEQHEDSHGQNYREHLEKEHRPEVEA